MKFSLIASVLCLATAGLPWPGLHALAQQDFGAFPTFEYHRIDNHGRKLGQTALVDVDNDVNVDIVGKLWDKGDEHFFLRNLAVEADNRGK